MKSGLRRLARAAAPSGPPVPLTGRSGQGSMIFDLGAGRASREAMMRAYSRSGTVFSIVSLLQQDAAKPRWHLYRKQPQDGRRRYSTGDMGSDQRTEVVQHAALKLWNRPNEFMSGFEFREGSNQHEELTGETFWVLNREVAAFPTSMWYVRPDRMQPVTDPHDFLIGWVYTGPGGEQVPLKADEVILEKLPDPLDPLRGAGPVSSVMANIEQQDYATRYQRNLFYNGADPGGIIQVPTKLTDRDFDQLITRWREAHQGIARAGRVGVLEGTDVKWIPGGQSNKDMEYMNLRLANRDELREAWRIHKTMIGTADDVNRANAQTAQEVHVAWQTIPRLERRRDTLNFKLRPMFGDDSVEFDFEDPSPVNQENANAELLAKSQAAQALIAAGFDPHDVLETVGLPDMDTTGQNLVQAQSAEDGSGDAGGAGIGDRLAQRERIAMKRDPKAKVLQQLAKDYPPGAMAWAHHAQWSGPVSLPVSHFKPDMKWLDLADPKHVADFVQEIAAGKKLKPVIAVKTPGRVKPHLVDGHHRYLAAEQEDVPVRAYIATVDADHGDWETMHDRQIDSPGTNKANLAGADMAALLRRVLNDGYVPVETGGRR